MNEAVVTVGDRVMATAHTTIPKALISLRATTQDDDAGRSAIATTSQAGDVAGVIS